MLFQMKVEYETECVVRILKDVFKAYCKMQYQDPLENMKKMMILWKTCHVWQRLEPDVSRIDATTTCLAFHRAYYVCGMVSVSCWLPDIIQGIFSEWIWWHFILSCTRNSFGFWQVIDTIPRKCGEKSGKLHDKHLHHDPESVSEKNCSFQ